MTILTVKRDALEKLVGKVDLAMENKITAMGTPIEETTREEISVEVFPNRPDLLSLRNFARAINQYNGREKVSSFKVHAGEKDYLVEVDKSVKDVRPYTVCAIIKGLKLDQNKIFEIIDVQEKLHNSIGRKRRKVAIGVYPLDKISLPIKFSAKDPQDIKFLPLDSSKKMTAREILKSHPKGRDFAHLLKGATVYPIFTDSNDSILSMPPIINSEVTGRVDPSTKDVFIECSGNNLAYCSMALNILLSSMDQMGGKIYSMEVRGMDSGKITTPQMDSVEMKFSVEDISKTLGIELTAKDVKSYLSRMGIDVSGKTALIPCYRADVLHPIDLAEDVAIAYGYENFIPEIPDISTIGSVSKESKVKKLVGDILSGLGLLEISSYHLVNKRDVKKMHYDYNSFIEVEASKTDRDVLRMDLITNLLQNHSENSNSSYPQKIFEVGRVFELDETGKTETGIIEKEHLAISLIDENIKFTELKQTVDYLFKMLDIEYRIENIENNNFIEGRAGEIYVNDSSIGFIGEVAPRVLKNWKIKAPVVSMEIDLSFLN